jgi:hypothetical protein
VVGDAPHAARARGGGSLDQPGAIFSEGAGTRGRLIGGASRSAAGARDTWWVEKEGARGCVDGWLLIWFIKIVRLWRRVGPADENSFFDFVGWLAIGGWLASRPGPR